MSSAVVQSASRFKEGGRGAIKTAMALYEMHYHCWGVAWALLCRRMVAEHELPHDLLIGYPAKLAQHDSNRTSNEIGAARSVGCAIALRLQALRRSAAIELASRRVTWCKHDDGR